MKEYASFYKHFMDQNLYQTKSLSNHIKYSDLATTSTNWEGTKGFGDQIKLFINPLCAWVEEKENHKSHTR